MKFSNWLSLTALIASLFIAWTLKNVFIIIFAGIILAVALCTFTRKIKTTLSIPRGFALIIALISVLLILILSLIIVIPQFTKELQELIIQLPNSAKALVAISDKYINNLSEFLYGQDGKDILRQNLFKNTIEILPDGVSLANGITDSLNRILNIAGNLGLGIVQVIFVFSISLMISVNPNAYKESFILLVPSFYRRRARDIIYKCGEALSSWMVGVLISSSFVAILAGICLYALGIKLVFANALLAGILNIIPNIGPTISTIFPMSVALLDAPWKSIAVLGLYIIIQNIESYLITPSIMQYQVKLLPAITLTSQFIFTVIFGPIGLLLSLPLTVILKILIKEVIIHDILDKKSNHYLRDY